MTGLSPLRGRLLPATHGAARLALHLGDLVAAHLVKLVRQSTQDLLARPAPGVFRERSVRIEAELAADLALAYARLPRRIGRAALLPLVRRRGALPRLRADRLVAMRAAIARAHYQENRSSNPLPEFNSGALARKSARGAPAGNLNRLSHGRHARFARAERGRLAVLKAEIADLIADCNAAVALFREAAVIVWCRRTAPCAAIPRLLRPRSGCILLRRRLRHIPVRRRAHSGQRAPPMATLRR